MSLTTTDRCNSCQGAVELGTDNGPIVCPDCFGEGRQLDSLERVEWRLRDIEQAHQGAAHGCESEVRWLVLELRRSRDALLKILSRCQDASDSEGNLAAAVKYDANQALGLYAVRPV